MATVYCQRREWVVLLLLIHVGTTAQGQSPLFDGETFTGYKLRETADEWQLRVPATGQTHHQYTLGLYSPTRSGRQS